MLQRNTRYILALIATIFAISAPGQTDDYDYEFMPVEDDAPIMKLPADTTRNCVVTFTATTDDGNGGTLSATYYDGLGRIREEVHTGITPKKNDIVTFHEYNSLERKAWPGIPVATSSAGTGCKTKDKFLEAAMQTTGDNHPYTQYSYERATLGRMAAVTGPGDTWHEAGKAVRYAYMTNRPAKTDFDNGKSFSYMYDAEGEKLRVTYVLDLPHIVLPTTLVMQAEDGDITKGIPYGTDQKIQIGIGNIDSLITRPETPIVVPYGMRILDYCENIIYDNYKFDRLLFDGGYVTFLDDAPIYHFYLKDYLGNVRVVFNQDGTVEQVNQYYPFGALFYNDANDEFQRYKFNGKELDRLLGIDWYDYGARMYDPILCRWNTPDPLADDYQNISPYAYCLDNPVKFVDPDGRSVWTKMLKGGYRMAKAVSKKGFSALAQADTYYDIVSDITENANTLLSDEASTEEKVIAGASLASEFLPVSIGDVKDGVKIVKAVHGNSKASTRAQHAYDIRDKINGKIVKTGVSSGKIRKDGKSYRAESQVRKWNRQEGEDRYESIITHKEPAGKNAREKIYDYEKDRANTLREQGHLKDEYKHKRP